MEWIEFDGNCQLPPPKGMGLRGLNKMKVTWQGIYNSMLQMSWALKAYINIIIISKLNDGNLWLDFKRCF